MGAGTTFETWLTQPPAQISGAHPQLTGAPVVTKEKETRRKANMVTAEATGGRGMMKYTSGRLSRPQLSPSD